MATFKWAAICLMQLAAEICAAKYPPVSTNCTDASSESVSWEIRNFTFDSNARLYYGPGTAGKVSFSIKNTANGYAFDCMQGANSGRAVNQWVQDGKVWYGCNVYCYGAGGRSLEEDPPLRTAFSFDVTAKNLAVSQVWSCGTSGITVKNYTGVGTTVVSNTNCTQIPDGRPEQVSCSPVDVTVKASKVQANLPAPNDVQEMKDNPEGGSGGIPFRTPRLPPPIPQILHDTPGCSKRSQNLTWTVSELFPSEYGVRFTLTNNALNYTERCSFNEVTSSFEARLQEKGYFNCTRFDPMHANYPANGVYTTILYGGMGNHFGVNQSWYCNDEDLDNPTVYSAYAETKLLVKCNETRHCTPPGPFELDPNLFIEHACRADDVTLSPLQTHSLRVSKQQALEDFKPHGYNCTPRSLGSQGPPTWEISAVLYNRTWISGNAAQNQTGGYKEELRFNYQNNATDSDWPMNTRSRSCSTQVSPGDMPFDGSQQLVCDEYQLQERYFRFDANSSTLTLDQAWSCDGTDIDHTNFFKAVGSVHIPLQCATVANSTKCSGENRISVPMVNLTMTLNAESERL